MPKIVILMSALLHIYRIFICISGLCLSQNSRWAVKYTAEIHLGPVSTGFGLVLMGNCFDMLLRSFTVGRKKVFATTKEPVPHPRFTGVTCGSKPCLIQIDTEKCKNRSHAPHCLTKIYCTHRYQDEKPWHKCLLCKMRQGFSLWYLFALWICAINLQFSTCFLDNS